MASIYEESIDINIDQIHFVVLLPQALHYLSNVQKCDTYEYSIQHSYITQQYFH